MREARPVEITAEWLRFHFCVKRWILRATVARCFHLFAQKSKFNPNANADKFFAAKKVSSVILG